jgi:hypothetical protein
MKDKAQFHLRISKELLKVVSKEAKRENRSVTAQVIYILEYYFGGLGLLPKEKSEK